MAFQAINGHNFIATLVLMVTVEQSATQDLDERNGRVVDSVNSLSANGTGTFHLEPAVDTLSAKHVSTGGDNGLGKYTDTYGTGQLVLQVT